MNSTPSTIETIPLIWMAGQSNMDGLGWTSDLPESLRGIQPERWIYSPNRRKDGEPGDRFTQWHSLKPGFGSGVSHNRWGLRLSDRFGVELSFSSRMRELRPEMPLALLKVAKGGSSLHPEPPTDWGTWDPDLSDHDVRNQFTYLMEAIARSASIPLPEKNQRVASRPSLFIWIQGESDAAFGKRYANEYKERLRRFLKRVRALAEDDTLSILLVELSTEGQLPDGSPSQPWASVINEAQQQLTDEDPDVHRIRLPESHHLQDPWHYDSATLLELGERLADVADKAARF
ncbi:MAG: sialate O-acetylesterase [Bacteroidota bacterium]